ncbi:ETS homologous factor-like [Chrysoperla carnea]|uniref:ETS homologous factor-like n=1 Tax=Chrysoperla carnea TaxID=189513 RepID=UPI001D079FE5|nr:ETS homologous factor-like [Chrysoperla carnea]
MDFFIEATIIGCNEVETDDNYFQLRCNWNYDVENILKDVYRESESSSNDSQISTDVTGDSNCEHTPALQWTQDHTIQWIQSYIAKNCFDPSDFKIDNFTHIKNGTHLYSMTLEDFIICDPKYGPMLYNGIQARNHSQIFPRYDPQTCNALRRESLESQCTQPEESRLDDLYRPESLDEIDYNSHLPTVLSTFTDTTPSNMPESKSILHTVRRGRGRPRGRTTLVKKKEPKNSLGRLWEFIRNLLHDPNYCPAIIKWENHEKGEFRFVTPERVAQIWGSRKRNTTMNFEKFSRALRYYYDSEIFQPVNGHKLVYKFGPSAKGWQTNNPNFEKQHTPWISSS